MFNATVFISSAYPGITRAEREDDNTWRTERLLDGFDVRCFTADPHRPGVLYAGTQGSGVLRSNDWGRTWFPSGLQNEVVKSLAFSPSQPDFMVAGTKPPLIYASDDGGQSWRELDAFRRIPSRPLWRSPAEPPGVAYVQSISISPTDPDVMVAGIEFGAVVRSSDGGSTWSGHRSGSVRDCHSLLFHASDGRYVYEAGGTGAGAAFSRDGGDTWQQPRAGLDRNYGWATAADPADPGIWYVSAAPGPRRAHSEHNIADAHVYRFENGGWKRLGGGLPRPLNSMPYALITNPDAPGHVYVGLHDGSIYHSPDHGDHWQLVPVSMGRISHALIMMP